MEFLHQKLLEARTKDQEDRIVNLMYGEYKKNRLFDKKLNYSIKSNNSK